MKKIFSLLLCGVLCGLVACDDKKNEPDNEPNTTDSIIVDSTETDSSEVNFIITVTDITSSTAEVAVECDSAELFFFFDEVELATIEGVDIDVVANDILTYYYGSYEAQKEFIEQEYGFTSFEEAYLSQGFDGFSFTGLTPNTAHAIVAFTVDMSGKVPAVGAVDSVHFSTLAVEPSSNIFTLDTTDYNFAILPTNYDTYFWLYENKDSLAAIGIALEDYFDGVVTLYNMTGMFEIMLASGAEQWYYCDIFKTPGNYQILVAGVEAGIRTTDLFIFDMHVTQEKIDEGECEPVTWSSPAKADALDKTLKRLNKRGNK